MVLLRICRVPITLSRVDCRPTPGIATPLFNTRICGSRVRRSVSRRRRRRHKRSQISLAASRRRALLRALIGCSDRRFESRSQCPQRGRCCR